MKHLLFSPLLVAALILGGAAVSVPDVSKPTDKPFKPAPGKPAPTPTKLLPTPTPPLPKNLLQRYFELHKGGNAATSKTLRLLPSQPPITYRLYQPKLNLPYPGGPNQILITPDNSPVDPRLLPPQADPRWRSGIGSPGDCITLQLEYKPLIVTWPNQDAPGTREPRKKPQINSLK